METYVRCYKRLLKNPSFPHSAATATPSLRNGEKKAVQGPVGCSEKREAPPGKPDGIRPSEAGGYFSFEP
jgi:hypothetical protein